MDCTNTVLIVDDDTDIRASLSEVLTDEGYSVMEAAHGRDAIAVLHAREPAPCVILLDLMMPEMDGYEFRRQQLRDARIASIPVVVFSADGQAGAKVRAMNVQGTLSKPAPLSEVLAMVATFCTPPPRAPRRASGR